MKFDITEEREEVMVHWDIEADDELIEFAVRIGREQVTERDYFELGMNYILKQAVKHAEETVEDTDKTA